MKAFSRRSVVIGGVLLVSGCNALQPKPNTDDSSNEDCTGTEENWSSYQRNHSNAGKNGDFDLGDPEGANSLVSVDHRRGGIVTDGTAAYLSNGKEILAYDIPGEAVEWRTQIGQSDYTPCLYCNYIVVPQVDKLVAVQKSDGKSVWETERLGLIRSPPIIVGSEIYISTGEKLYKISAKDGTVSSSSSIDQTSWGLCSNGERIYCSIGGKDTPSLKCVDMNGLSEEWSAERLASVKSPPTYDGDTLYCSTDSGDAVAVDGEDGSTIWSKNVVEDRSPSPLAVDDLVIVASGNGDTTVALDRSTGSVQWTLTTGPVLSPPIADGDSIYVGTMNKGLYKVNFGGDVISHLENPNVGSPMCLAPRNLLFKSRFRDPQAYIV